jgi:hypothetical protein
MIQIRASVNVNSRSFFELIKQIKTAGEEVRITVGPSPFLSYGKLKGTDVVKILNKGDRKRRIPARPFLAIALAKNSEKYRSHVRRRIAKGWSNRAIAKSLQTMLVNDVVQVIEEFKTPDNALSTKLKKNFRGKVLIWRRRLVNSIVAKVTLGGKNKFKKVEMAVAHLHKEILKFNYKGG